MAPSRCTPSATGTSALADALGSGGTSAGADFAGLMGAAQCDLLITGMLHGCEDYAEVPPIEESGPRGDRARELLRWALAGTVPDRFRGPLLAPADAAALTSLARDRSAGTAGPGLDHQAPPGLPPGHSRGAGNRTRHLPCHR